MPSVEGRQWLSLVVEDEDRSELAVERDAILGEGARRMLVRALQAEVDESIAAPAGEGDATAKALVVPKGRAGAPKVTTFAGQLEVLAPRVNHRRQHSRLTRAILPPWARRSPRVAEVLPGLCLRGI